MKKGYVLLQVNVNDPEVFKKYPELSEKIISKFGGKYLFRGGEFEVLEGSWDFKRNVLLEFDNIIRQAITFRRININLKSNHLNIFNHRVP